MTVFGVPVGWALFVLVGAWAISDAAVSIVSEWTRGLREK